MGWEMINFDLIKAVLILIAAIFLLSILFGFLFKVGVLLLIGLGIMYLVKRVFFE